MRAGLRSLLAVLALASLAACGNKQEPAGLAAEMAAARPAEVAGAPAADAAQSPRRYRAVRHTIVLEAPAAQIEPLWRQLQAKVEALGGEVAEAGLERDYDGNPTASLSLRLPPSRVAALFELLAQHGELVSTRTSTEDKTAQVIDVEAHLKNLTEARDSLRKLMDEKTGKLSDVLEVQKQLTEMQSQLDSYAGQRKALAQETEMVAIALTLRAPRSLADRSALAPLREAWHSAGQTAGYSLAGLVTFIAAITPWMLLIVPLFLWIRRAWQSRRAARM